jgi:phosphatidate cytidylyltransferase
MTTTSASESQTSKEPKPIEVTTEAETSNPPKKRNLSNLFRRFFTGMILLPFIIIIVWVANWPFTIAIGILMGIGILEFYFMEKKRGLQNNSIMGIVAAIAVLLSAHFREPLYWQIAVLVIIITTFIMEFARGRIFKDSFSRIATTVFGIFYIAFPFSFLIAIRQVEPHGLHWIFAVIYSTWGTDTLAYLVGNIIGKTPFVPALSPKKTWEGAIGGIFFGAILPMFVLAQVNELNAGSMLLLIIAPFAATAGDLFESAVKRFFGVKDSHIPGFDILPGHGGVLDRVDSLIWVATVFYIYLVWAGKIALLI